MVLSNSSDDDSSSFSVPASNTDPYSSSSQTGFPDVNKYPKAFQFIGSSPVAAKKHLVHVIQLRLNRAAALLQRPPTYEEADALGYWAARQARIVSFAWPASIISGTYRSYTTRRTYKIPFYTPDHERWTNYINQIEKGTGANAQLLRGLVHTSRWALYVMVGNVVASVLLNSYAASVCTVGELGDKRLKAYLDAVKEAAQKEFAERREGQKHKGPFSFPQQKHDGAKHESNDDSPAWQNVDDASPTGGAYNDTHSSYGSGNGSVGSSQIEGQTRSKSTIAREPPQIPEQYQSQPQDDGNGDPFRMMERNSENFDNSSSAAGRSAETDSNGGSAWDRIRRRAAGTKSSPPTNSALRPRNPAQQDSGYDSFSFSAAERDGQTARGEAQKEFDARVEQERRGGDFGRE